MAKRKYSKMSKIQPSVQTMLFRSDLVPSGSNDTFYIDLSQCASIMNRRFYRQGINWAVSSVRIQSTTFEGQVIISKLPNTWVMSNAWEKAFRAWQKMNNEVTSEGQSLKPKFLDFKIFADSQHESDGFSRNLLPYSIGGLATNTPAIKGEWVESKIYIPTSNPADGSTDQFNLIACGDNTATAKSLIDGYAASRGLPNIADPNTPDDAISYSENWLLGMFNDGTVQDVDVVRDLTGDNDIAPYPFENDGVNFDTVYPGGANQLEGLQIHSFDFVTPTTIGGNTTVKGGNFPCGLMRIDAINTASTASIVQLEVSLVPGNHRGYLCEPMTEM